jgi:hypothetical protein
MGSRMARRIFVPVTTAAVVTVSSANTNAGNTTKVSSQDEKKLREL